MSIAPAQKAAPKQAVQKAIVRSLEGEVTSGVSFWLMRQAGRYLPEYRALRESAGSFLNLCFAPENAAEVTLQPIRRFDMDAAILFSDILVVPHALGQSLDFVHGEGPRLGALQDEKDFKQLSMNDFDARLDAVYETVKIVRRELAPEKTLIGFAGSPWTVACYMLQGRGDGVFAEAKKCALQRPDLFAGLMETLVDSTTHYLLRQIESGVDVVQLFDSWAGLLPEAMFAQWVIEPTKEIVSRIHAKHPNFPVIGFPRQAGCLSAEYAEKTGIQGLGLDTQASITWATKNVDKKICLQGNLDPVILLTGGKALETEVLRILEAAKEHPFIFNLGHGIIKETPPEHVAQLSEIIKGFKR